MLSRRIGDSEVTLTRIIAVVSLTMASVASVALATSPVAASINGTASLTLSGAARGTLHEGPQGLCTNARGMGVDLIGLQGSISGFRNVASWTLVVAAKSARGGSYKVASNGDPGGQLDPIAKHATVIQSQAAILNSSSGTFKFKGYKGTLRVTFGSGKHAIEVTGSWNCQA